jgi:hypothetical protein
MKPKLLLGLALVLSSVLFGCSSIASRNPYEAVTTAINHEDWVALQRLAKPGMRANDYIPKWEKNPVRVGKLIRVEKDAKYYLDGKPCTIYSFDWESKDGTPSLHQLQILVREEDGKSIILDFWNFGW